jgi:hypothetical protein
MSSDANLFGMTPKPKRAKTAPAPNGAVQSGIALYVRLFVERFNEKPVITPADGKAVKQLVTQFSQEKVEQRLPLYMALDDAYLLAAGYPLRLLPGQWNKLTVTLQPRGDTAVERTSDYLRKLRGSTHGG